MSVLNFTAVTPAIRICLDFEVCPETISTSLFGTPSFFAKSFVNSAFAAPSTGGEASLTFTEPSISPTISDLEARGTTLTAKSTAPSFSEILIKAGIDSPDEHVQHHRLQQHYHDQHQHPREVEHSDRRYHTLDRKYDRVGDAFDECEESVPVENEPGR